MFKDKLVSEDNANENEIIEDTGDKVITEYGVFTKKLPDLVKKRAEYNGQEFRTT